MCQKAFKKGLDDAALEIYTDIFCLFYTDIFHVVINISRLQHRVDMIIGFKHMIDN